MTSPRDADVPTILIVDDQPSNRLTLDAVLGPLGYRIITAASGEEALKRVGEEDFVLIVMDVNMPVLDGYETTARIREHPQSRDVPVIFLTAADNQPEQTYRGYALGAVDYITKPFDAEVLRGKVRALVLLYTRGQRSERERREEKERMKDLLLGAIGHDLRNPLNAITLGMHSLLRDGDCGNPRHAAVAQKVDRAARRMQRMIEDILDLTREQFTGSIPISPQPTNLGDLCRGVVDEARLAHPGRAIELDVGGGLGGVWDPDRLGRAISNLVGNALEHGGRSGPVQVRVRREGDGVSLEFHNAGPPIDAGILPALFEPFHHGPNSTLGLGLGLYIVREIVRAHGGSIDVSSTLTAGTTFRVTLPRVERTGDAAVAACGAGSTSTATVSGGEVAAVMASRSRP